MTQAKLLQPFLILVVILLGCGDKRSRIHNIFGDDERVRITTRDFPFSGLGKLNTACSGVLIHPKLLLTAAHCVFDSKEQRPRPAFTKFDIGLINGQTAGSAAPVRGWIGSTTPEDNRGADWAIVELDQPFTAKTKFMNIHVPEIDHTLPYAVNLAGYSGDVNAGLTPSVHWSCAIRKIDTGRLFHDCDSTAGISGAPMFVSINDEWKLIGISVSEFRHGETPPVTRTVWSEEYSNVAVSSQAFQPVASQILQSLTKGLAIPEIKSAITIDFEQTTDTPNETPQNPTTPPQPPIEQPLPELPVTTPSHTTRPQLVQAPDLVFSFQNMQNLNKLVHSLPSIQTTLRSLSRTLEDILRVTAGERNPFLLEIANDLANKFAQNNQAWLSLEQCAAIHRPCYFEPQYIFHSYVYLKHADIDFRRNVMKFPSSQRDQIIPYAYSFTTILRQFEQIVFMSGQRF